MHLPISNHAVFSMRLLKPLCILSALFIITSCATPDSASQTEAIDAELSAQAPFAALIEPLDKTAEEYLKQARLALPSKQPDQLIMATRRYLEDEQYQPANAILADLGTKEMTPIQQAGVAILSAQILIQNRQLDQAATMLEFDPEWSLPVEYIKQYHELRANLFALQNNPIAAAKERILLDDKLSDEEQLRQNHEQIWGLLKPFPATTLRSFVNAQAPDNERGWFELAAMSNEAISSPDELAEALRIWRTFYPNHPAREIMPASLEAALIAKPLQPERIAVLLPLSGKRQQQGEAIRDGIISAFLDNKGQQWQPKLFFYDSTEPMEKLYNELLAMDNQMIIGPLVRQNVEKLLALQPQLPVLALNRVSAHKELAEQFFFALSPEDEAENAAKQIDADGHKYPVIIAPKGAFGDRVGAAFMQYWQELGHEPAELYQFEDQKHLQQTVQQMLGVTDSKQRIKQISRIAGALETEPRSRRDLDSIYIVSKPTQARLIKPFVEVDLSPGLARPDIYISSRSNGKKQSMESTDELEGVFMSEMPWMLSPEPPQKIRAQQQWPERSPSLQRLYAMGYDSFNLIPQLVQLRAFPGFKLPALTGQLSVNTKGEVKRGLNWTRFGSNTTLDAESLSGK